MKHKKYILIFNTEDFIDGIEFDSFSEAKEQMITIYYNWMESEQDKWKIGGDFNPIVTEEQIDDWNRMICECCCWISEWNKETKSYNEADNDCYFLSNKELKEINWLEYDEAKKYWEF